MVTVTSATGIRFPSPAGQTGAVGRVYALLAEIPDPEIPALSVLDLGIVRSVREVTTGGIEVTITPTYSGCPAMGAIEDDIREKLAADGFARVSIKTELSPAWTTDWMSEAGREKLRQHGIAPPGQCADSVATLRFVPRCPQCGSPSTERLAEFGSTTCKSLYRCLECGEPFDYFKPL